MQNMFSKSGVFTWQLISNFCTNKNYIAKYTMIYKFSYHVLNYTTYNIYQLTKNIL